MSAPPDKTEADPLVPSPQNTSVDPYATVPPQAGPDTEGEPIDGDATNGEATTDPWGTIPPVAGAPSRSRQLKIAPQVRIPGYDVLRELGRGGMGVVYLARQQGLDRMVALKMILSGDHASSQQSKRFHAEAQAISRLQHPNLVQIYEVGENEGRPYFSLEFVDGGTLQEKFRGAPQPPAEAARLIEVLARAVHYAHQRGIVHRDLKPANVLLMHRASSWARRATWRRNRRPAASTSSRRRRMFTPWARCSTSS
jgi:predicted Ser/Thr protein kinase